MRGNNWVYVLCFLTIIGLFQCNQIEREIAYLENYPNYIDSLLIDTIRNYLNINYDSLSITTKTSYAKVYSRQDSASIITEKAYIDSGQFIGNSELKIFINDSIIKKEYFFNIDTTTLKFIYFVDEETILQHIKNTQDYEIPGYKIIKDF